MPAYRYHARTYRLTAREQEAFDALLYTLCVKHSLPLTDVMTDKDFALFHEHIGQLIGMKLDIILRTIEATSTN